MNNSISRPSDHPNRRDSSPSGAPSFVAAALPAEQDGNTLLRPDLKERHVNMMAFSAALGVGLFLQAGRVIYLTGPGLAVIAYLLVGSVMWSVMASLGEMTAVFPVKGPLFEFPRRFLDQSIGFATAWLVWFAWVVILAAQSLAITQIFAFSFRPKPNHPNYLQTVGYPQNTLEWKFGQPDKTNPGIWVILFLLAMGFLNLLPVKWYGRIEYLFGCIKIIFIVGLIMFNVVLNARKRYHSSRFWTYSTPYSFASQNFTSRLDANEQPVGFLDGQLGTFAGMWTGITFIVFSMIGFEVVAVTAAENRDIEKEETMKIASRKISLRIIVLYTLAAFTAGLNVPYTDTQLQDLALNSVKGGQTSIFVLAAVREHVTFWPHFFNGFFVFSSAVAGANGLYSASRALHALASTKEAWPRWKPVQSLRKRLERTFLGVPYAAVFVSWLFGFLAFLATKKSPAETLSRIITNSVVSMLIVYAVNCAAYLSFYTCMKAAAEGEDSELGDGSAEKPQDYNRRSPQYPYMSRGQWLRAAYGLFATTMLALFNGWRSFISPMNGKDFVASYLSIIIFGAITLAYLVKFRGPKTDKLANLKPKLVLTGDAMPNCDFCGGKHRRGTLKVSGNFSWNSIKAVLEWIWTWLK